MLEEGHELFVANQIRMIQGKANDWSFIGRFPTPIRPFSPSPIAIVRPPGY